MAATVPTSAKQIVADFLKQYGLGGLANWAWGIYTSVGGDLQSGIEAIKTELPNTPAFKARFPAYEQMAKSGHAMSIDAMLAYENTVRGYFHDAGLPAGFYDKPDDFAKFMVAGVSADEVRQRVQIAQQEVFSFDPEAKAQLENLYGLTTGHFVAHALDPTTALPLLERQATAAQVAAEAQRTMELQLSRRQAENLALLGVDQSQARQGFQQLGQEAGLFQAQTTGEQTIGVNEQLAAQFGGDTTAQLEFQRRQAQRKAQFAESSGFGVTQAGVGGIAPSQRGA